MACFVEFWAVFFENLGDNNSVESPTPNSGDLSPCPLSFTPVAF